jgi:hypothetical protein
VDRLYVADQRSWCLKSVHELEDLAAVGGVESRRDLISGNPPAADSTTPVYDFAGFEEHLERRRRQALGLPGVDPADRDQARVDAFIDQATAEWASKGIEVKVWSPARAGGEGESAQGDDHP